MKTLIVVVALLCSTPLLAQQSNYKNHFEMMVVGPTTDGDIKQVLSLFYHLFDAMPKFQNDRFVVESAVSITAADLSDRLQGFGYSLGFFNVSTTSEPVNH